MTQSVLSHDLRAMLLDITVPLQTFADYVDVPMDRVLLEQCMDFVEARYSEDAKLRGVLSRLGIMLVSGDPEAAFRCFEVDDRNGRITTVSRLYFAELLARKGLIDQAKTQVDTAYQLNPYFTDGYGRVAWELHWRAQKYELVVAGFVHDEAFGRLSSHGRVRLATALAAMGDLPNAEAQVFAAYREDSNVPNGYALIGWHYFMRRHRFADVLEYIERDRSLGRLAPEWTSNHALVLAAMGRLEDGISMVERGYAGHSHLRDCFTAMGWHLYTKHGEIGTSINLMRRDAEADRLSPSGMLKLVELLGQQTTTNEDTEFLLKESLALVQRAYALDGRLQDGHCALARGFTFTKDIEMVVALYLADLDQGRMSSRCFFEYVRYLCMAKGHEAAAREIEKAYEIRADLAGAFTILGSELIKRGEPELAAGYYEHDRILNRMPQGRAVSYAQLLANLGRVDELHQLLKTNLVTPDVYRFQALSLARRFVPDETWPRQAVPDANTCDPGEVSRMLAAMAPQARVEACRAFAEYHYERRAGLMDCLSCGARSALHEGDSDKALALFAGDRDLGRAENQSLLQYSSLLGDEALARKVREEALARYGFAQDPWLTASRDRHEGQRCFLVGTGPSMKRIDCGLLKGEVVFAVNGAIYLDRLIPTYFVSVSNMFWRHHTQAIRDLSCRRFLPFWMHGPLDSDCPTSWLNAPMPRTSDAAGQHMELPLFFSDEPNRFVALGGTVMFVCLQLALYLGFEQVVLLGVDHNYGTAAGKSVGVADFRADQFTGAHFMKQYYRGGFFNLDFLGMERAYSLALQQFERNGKHILNATPGTKLETYPKVALESIL